MGQEAVLASVTEAMVTFVVLALPPLLAALVVGLTIGILQTATQIQDQTMPQIFKLLTILLVFVAMAPVLVAPLIAHAERVFTEFPQMVR